MSQFKVVQIVDGDTSDVDPGWKWNGSTGERVRPTGYDAPELHEHGGQATKKRLADLVLGETVTLGTGYRVDRGRLVCDVLFQGRNLADALVKGHAAVAVASGYLIASAPTGTSTGPLQTTTVYVKNGFHTRDWARANDPLQIVDPRSTAHWDLLGKVEEAGATLLALAEIDKLESDKVRRFSRFIVLDEGRIVADSRNGCFAKDLARWGVVKQSRRRACL